MIPLRLETDAASLGNLAPLGNRMEKSLGSIQATEVVAYLRGTSYFEWRLMKATIVSAIATITTTANQIT